MNFSNAKIFRAGAGAGKTTQLVSEVYAFYSEYKNKNKKVPKIVLTTFTRKATQEIKERLMIKAQQEKDYDFLDYVLSKGHLLISTIHGVLQVFLRQNAHDIQLDPGFKIVDKATLSREAKLILREILYKNEDSEELLKDFSFQQLVSLLMRHSDSIMRGKDISTFTQDEYEKSSNEILISLVNEIHSIENEIHSSITSETWKVFANRLLKISEALKNKNFEEVEDLLKGYKKPVFSAKKNVVTAEFDSRVSDVLKKIRNIDFELLSNDLMQKFLIASSVFEKLSFEFHERFLKFKKEKGMLSLGDLESMSLLILKEDQGKFSAFSKNYDYWLIDEFQDTSPVQVQLLMQIIGGQKFFVVGDPQQSIYFFRGARVKVFDQMQNQIVLSGGQLHELKKNYRSSPEIMNFINYFFKNYDQNFLPMDIGGVSDNNSSIKIGLFENKDVQAENIAQYILNLPNDVDLGNVCIIARKNDDLKWIAKALKKNNIPYYLHSAQGFSKRREILDLKSFMKFLINSHDNTSLVTLLRSPWFAMEENVLSSTLLRCDDSSFWPFFLKQKDMPGYESIAKLYEYLLRSQKTGISQCIQDFLYESSILESALQVDPTGRFEANIWKFLIQLRQEDHLFDFNYLKFLEGQFGEESTEEGGEDSDAVSSLESNQVQLMTVHMSKGLEFDYVILPHFEKAPQIKHYVDYIFDEQTGRWCFTLRGDEMTSLTPIPMKKIIEGKIEEELQENHRLLYVALTRAKKHLFLTSAGKPEAKSWLSSIQFSLEEGAHSVEGVSYDVVTSIAHENKDTKLRETLSEEILLPLFNMQESEQYRRIGAITQQMNWVDQGVKSVVPLMESAFRGVQTHRIFELLKYKERAEVLGSLSEVDKEAVSWVLDLKEIPFQKILKNGFPEWGFVNKSHEGIISGQIDLWAIVDECIWILDYKTGSSKFSEKAFIQLKSYARAIADMYAYDIFLVALYPFEKKVIVKKHT